MDKVNKLLQSITVKEQFMMSLIALVGMWIMVIVTGVYIYFFTDFSLTFRIIAVVNAFFGVLFIFSMIATTYQQYQSYLLIEQGKDIAQLFGDIMDKKEEVINPGDVMLDNTLKGGLTDNGKENN